MFSQWVHLLEREENKFPLDDGGIVSAPINSAYHFFDDYLDGSGIPKPTGWYLSGAAVNDIASQMTDGSVGDASLKDGKMGAGYTYLGQLITHDITKESLDIRIEEGFENSTETLTRDNYTPFLDLGCIYPIVEDEEFEETEFLREIDQDGCFNLGAASREREGSETDLLRENGLAIIPEPRNDENIIVAQLHLFWQVLHNRVVRHYLLKSRNSQRHERYHHARKFVTLIFQQVVIQDYSRRILHPEVYRYCLDKDNGSRGTVFCSEFEERLTNGEVNEVPREFSLALFRFGHSLIRPQYRFNEIGIRLAAPKLANTFKRGRRLNSDVILNWEFFFGSTRRPDSALNKALILNLRIASGLKEVPIDKKIKKPKFKVLFTDAVSSKASQYLINNSNRQKKGSKFTNLVISDIRSSRARPTGGDLLRAIKKRMDNAYISEKLKAEIGSLESRFQFSDNCILSKVEPNESEKLLSLDNAPLWLFMLREAELWPNAPQRTAQRRGMHRQQLGPLSSIIVAETIYMSINNAQISALRELEESSLGSSALELAYRKLSNTKSGPNMAQIIKFSNDISE